ncbi:MAG: helix-turn-helix domain-containing protein [Rhodobacteraceae bacterium]|jgi:transcriptional regulator with XRE-family HTH domain|nr:helix-turn-helix domain-containing protein [Paracoccaceae bacterium]
MSDNPATPEIVERLHLLRVRHGLTIQQMAERCGLPKSSLESYMKMTGAKRPGLDALLAVADGMDVSIDWLVGRTDDSFSPKLTHREYALACFNAAVSLLRKARELGAASDGQQEAGEGQDYALAAEAMFDFLELIHGYQKSGKSFDRQAVANDTVAHFLKATGN